MKLCKKSPVSRVLLAAQTHQGSTQSMTVNIVVFKKGMQNHNFWFWKHLLIRKQKQTNKKEQFGCQV